MHSKHRNKQKWLQQLPLLPITFDRCSVQPHLIQVKALPSKGTKQFLKKHTNPTIIFISKHINHHHYHTSTLKVIHINQRSPYTSSTAPAKAMSDTQRQHVIFILSVYLLVLCVCISILQCFFLCLDALLACRREKEKRIINVLITKRLSIIAPKFHDNYLCTSYRPNGATFAIKKIFFWNFYSKIFGMCTKLSN